MTDVDIGCRKFLAHEYRYKYVRQEQSCLLGGEATTHRMLARWLGSI
jgi:hypothetical protein